MGLSRRRDGSLWELRLPAGIEGERATKETKTLRSSLLRLLKIAPRVLARSAELVGGRPSRLREAARILHAEFDGALDVATLRWDGDASEADR